MLTHKYKIVCKLAQGGFGSVFLVKNLQNQNEVIKQVPLKTVSKYVLSELTILKSLDHPRIVKLIDFFPSTDCYNFVLEYAERGTLRNLLTSFQEKRWKFAEKDVMEIFTDVAYGVKFLHSKGIIHRDIKPENILMTRNFRIKLADFGVSKIVGECCPEIHTSIGTLSYMSPEVYLHQPYNKSADIWALGLIFYEMAFMKYPLTREEKTRILNPKIPYECPKGNWEARKYDPRLQRALEMMLQRDPRKRQGIEVICRFSLFVPYMNALEKEYAAYRLARKEEMQRSPMRIV